MTSFLFIENPDEFFYTQQGEDPIVDDVDDQKAFEETMEAMSMLGIYNEQQRMIWRILAAILHLGNVTMHMLSKNKDQCQIKVLIYWLYMYFHSGMYVVSSSQCE